MSHDEALELLPWFVNSSLPIAERGRVSAHVDACLQCRRIVQRDRQLLARMVAEPSADAAIDAGFRTLVRRIDRQQQAGPTRSGIPDRVLAPNTWAYAALMVAGLAVALWLARPRDGIEPAALYTTVIDSQAPRVNQLDVVFAANVDAAGRAAVAEQVGARAIAGPSEAGRYVLELDAGGDPVAAVEQALERLRRDARVQFAGRAFTDPGGE